MSKFLLATFLACSVFAHAQSGVALTDQDYNHAESFLYYNTAPFIDHGSVQPNWISDHQFWYRDLTDKGSEFLLVDAVKESRSAAFDQQKLAVALSAATGKHYEAQRLPFLTIRFIQEGNAIQFFANSKWWNFQMGTNQLTEAAVNASSAQEATVKRELRKYHSGEIMSPDGKKAVFLQGDNLWVRDLATGNEVQLTTDGIKDFGYATNNAGWIQGDNPIVRWSPDSKKIATFRQDQRHVSNMYLVSTNVGAPKLKQWKYEFPGDTAMMKIYRCVINVDTPKVVFLHIPADPHRATLSDDIASSGTFDDVDWSPDGSQLAFVSTSRDHKLESVQIANTETGDVRAVFEEKVPTQFESGWGGINWRFLAKSNEIIWFSERDNWGHLYLYDATTGKLKHQITKGDWIVNQLVKVDEKKRVLYFIANGLEKKNPYFAQLCSINFDGKNFKILTPEIGNHRISLSPSGDYFVDSYSQPDVPAITLLRGLDGRRLVDLEKTDVSRLVARGWKPVTPITIKAADGVTDLFGLMYTPTLLNKAQKYPIIDYIYPGPQGGSVGSWSFEASRGDNQALAELGFIVIQIEGTSNPLRSKDFHDRSYGNMSINTLPDQIAGIRQLSKRYSFMDTTRVGIWGHSGGGFATAAAMFRYPDFFKVGIAESGNHDNRNYEADWGDRYNGLISDSAYESQANESYAKNLKGKLLLVHGLMDDNVPPQNTLLVVQALEKANKDFDLIVFPNSRHGYGEFSPYMMRRRWDYFVRNLLGDVPPKQFELINKADPRNTIL